MIARVLRQTNRKARALQHQIRAAMLIGPTDVSRIDYRAMRELSRDITAMLMSVEEMAAESLRYELGGLP